MDKHRKGEILAFHDKLNPLVMDTVDLGNQVDIMRQSGAEFRGELNDLLAETQKLAEHMKLTVQLPRPLSVEAGSLNSDIDAVYFASNSEYAKAKIFPELQTEEIIFSAVAGLLSVMIDMVFVGTPEVVTIWRGGKNFDGSILTGLLRKAGKDSDGELNSILQWLSEHCKVPYDISAVKNIMYPNNHRLRSLSHDPFLGLFFAVADILMGTTTCIGNDGKIKILLNWQTDTSQKLLAVFYYIGHLLSDLCTARGLPVPGAFLTQFFVGDGSDDSLAKIAENMYRDGYDLRHFASMSVPVVVKDLLICAYLRITGTEHVFQGAFSENTEREYRKLQETLKQEKMLLIANTVATAGNVIKLVSPPVSGNPCAINAVQWFAMIRSGITAVKAANRDRVPESVIAARFAINQTWQKLKGIEETQSL
ncbi:MAG: hypothetical protein IJR54_07280 [Oscillibacter sp.]|nr:hypothetical protein [Oscillibacter sp.]